MSPFDPIIMPVFLKLRFARRDLKPLSPSSHTAVVRKIKVRKIKQIN